METTGISGVISGYMGIIGASVVGAKGLGSRVLGLRGQGSGFGHLNWVLGFRI